MPTAAAAEQNSANPTGAQGPSPDGNQPVAPAAATISAAENDVIITNANLNSATGSGEIPTINDIVTPDEIAEQLSSLANDFEENMTSSDGLFNNLDATESETIDDSNIGQLGNDAPIETNGSNMYNDPGGLLLNDNSSPSENLLSEDIETIGANSVDSSSSTNGPRDEVRSHTSDTVLRCRTTTPQAKSNFTLPKSARDEGGDSQSCNDTPSDKS